jgi:hypothetical protein
MNAVRESRAGDDFHLLWAARRALALLDPRSSLCLIRLEGLNPVDVVENDDRFLGVDLAEYFGGPSLTTASEVVVTQLKYSVRHPERSWSAARLGATKHPRGASVVRRLADIFAGLVEEEDGDVEAVVRTVRIRLVSNQRAAPAILTALARAQSTLNDLPVGTSTGRFSRSLTPKHRAVIQQLQGRSGLQSAMFSDFLRVLDLSGCGEDSRALQRVRISEQLGRLIVGPHTHGLPALVELMRSQVLPEASDTAGIGRADILAALGVANEEDLLPAPPRFEEVANVIPTPDPAALASMVLDAPRGKAVAHGPAGIGKTTAVLGLESHLPEGSSVIPYDCFGGGDYLSPGEERHTPRRALVQIANEISLRLGTEPLLLSAIAVEADLWRRFRQRLVDAAQALDQGAFLVVVIDAADNSIFAASRRGDRSFVEEMWELPLPDNVRLLMTCRTHRLDEISPPPDIVAYTFSGFDVDASTSMLRVRFADATIDDGRLFHERTHGVPRVQAYALAADQSDSIEAALLRSTKGLTEIFDDVLRAAFEERSDPLAARRDLATLFAMARPVHLGSLSSVLSVSLSVVQAIGASLQPGVAITGGVLQFPDEDFEHFLRDRLTEEDLLHAHSRLADHYLARRETDSEAALNVVEHLKEAGRDQELIDLVLDEPIPRALDDGLARTLASRRRLSLAIDASTRVGALEQSIKLVLLAAQVARSDTSLTNVIRSRPDLAARFADSEAIGTIYLREESAPWLGPAHFHVASVLSWNRHTVEAAKERLTQAEAWVRRWSLLDEHDRWSWELTAEDVGRGAAALWGLAGADAAAAFLARWQPPAVRAQAVPLVANIVAQHAKPATVVRDLRRLRASAWVQAQFIVALDEAGASAPRAWVDRVARRIAAIPVAHPVFATESRPEWGLAFCEAAVRARVPKRIAAELVSRLRPPVPTFAPPDFDPLDTWVAPLRSACLAAALERRDLQVDELLPQELRPNRDLQPGDHDPNAGKRRSFREGLEPHLPINMLRARGLVEDLRIDDVQPTVEEGLNQFREQARSRWFRSQHRYRTWATAAVDALVFAHGDATAVLRSVADIAQDVLVRTASLRVHLATTLIRRHVYQDVSLRFLDDAARELATEAYSASDRRDILLDAASAASRVDEEAAGELFAQAVDAAQGIDDDVGLHIAVLARLAAAAAPLMPRDRARAISDQFARSTEAVAPFVSDPSEVLPFTQVMATVATLDPPAAFALSSRWDDEDRMLLSESVPILIRQVSDLGWLNPEMGLRLLRLTSNDSSLVYGGMSLLDLIAARGPNSREALVRCFTVLADWTRCEVGLHERFRLAGALAAWASDHGLGELTGTKDLGELVTLAKSLEAGRAVAAHTTARDEKPAFTASGEEARDPGLLHAAVQEMLDQFVSEDSYERYFTSVLLAVGPQQRVTAMDQIAHIADDYPDRSAVVGGVARALRRALSQWDNSVRVQEWGTVHLPDFVERHLPRLFSIGSTRYGGWTTTLQTPFDLSVERIPDLLRATAARFDELSVGELFAVGEACAQLASSSTTAAVVEWGLSQVVPLETRDTAPDLPDERSEVLGLFLWSVLGHPDDRVRWRAAHCLRELLVEECEEGLADVVVGLLDTSSVGCFRAQDRDFYWLSARMWALLALARVAGDAPSVLGVHARRLAAIATDADLPHAAAREFARRAALRVAAHAPEALPADTVEELALANRPRVCGATRAYGFDRSRESTMDRDVTRFHFDTLDTTRYWYEPLARVFGLPGDDITRRADHWVTDVWGRTNEECRRDARLERNERDWYLRSNDHGSRPIIETLRTYLEYHAMLVVAGELIDEGVPIVIEPYDDAEDPWDYWIRHHLDTDPSCWLADR